MKKIIPIIIVIFMSGDCFGQAPQWAWAKSAGGASYDIGNSVSTDASGNVFMTGYFNSSSITFGTTTLTNVGFSDIFIVKYNASGNVLWAKSAGEAGNDVGNSVSTDASGNVFMTGSFFSPTITFGTITLTNAGGTDIFIVKYDTSGNVFWAKSAGGASTDYGFSVSTDASDNVIMTGYFNSPTITFGTTTLTNVGISDIFIVKYDASGNAHWAKSAGGNSDEQSRSVSSDASGNVFMTGWFFSPTITFGTTTLTNDTTGNTNDIFIVKLNGTTGIEELDNSMSLNLAPNPFTSTTTFTFDEPQKNTTIKIMDVLGNEIKTIRFSGKECVIEKGEMRAGVYFVEITSTGSVTGSSPKEVVRKKMVVQ